ncbi:hypothetical protein COB52_03865 [Candidatus Kaiserbacteria bacterium]|nr:MAG: hypothetical protein COB52_03865 [Candidatus Kaiserbacteria bacterium]
MTQGKVIKIRAANTCIDFEEVTPITSREMASELKVTFFPSTSPDLSDPIVKYSEKLRTTLIDLGVEVIPYEEVLEFVPVGKRLKRLGRIFISNVLFVLKKPLAQEHSMPWMGLGVILNSLRSMRMQKDIAVIALGSHSPGKLPVDSTSSFRKSSIVTVVDRPENISSSSSFSEHFDTAMDMFAYHMTNVIIAVSKEGEWTLYNFNAAHPTYSSSDEDMSDGVLNALIPKLSAPMQPAQLKEFIYDTTDFDPDDLMYKDSVNDLLEGSKLFGKTKLYPEGKIISDLPFRSSFYRWIGAVHLDQRNGMSYGFLARQLPTELEEVVSLEEFEKSSGLKISEDGIVEYKESLYIQLTINNEKLVVRAPSVWVLSQRSGSDKTNMNKDTDLVVMGLHNGRMQLRMAAGKKVDKTYKPSFDTKVILAHALGNALVASISSYLKINDSFVEQFKETGMAIGHWHGYINPKNPLDGLVVHGTQNPHVACSSPQSAIYALVGKMEAFDKTVTEGIEFKGDIHIEPHHGTNINCTSLCELAGWFIKDPELSELGNKYFTH